MSETIEQSMEVLASDDAFAIPDRKSRRKWSGPWWHMATLCEMGEAKRIPKPAVKRALQQLKHGAWPKFVDY